MSSSNLLMAYVDKLEKRIATKNSWGKNELILEMKNVEAEVLREAIELMAQAQATSKDLGPIR